MNYDFSQVVEHISICIRRALEGLRVFHGGTAEQSLKHMIKSVEDPVSCT